MEVGGEEGYRASAQVLTLRKLGPYNFRPTKTENERRVKRSRARKTHYALKGLENTLCTQGPGKHTMHWVTVRSVAMGNTCRDVTVAERLIV